LLIFELFTAGADTTGTGTVVAGAVDGAVVAAAAGAVAAGAAGMVAGAAAQTAAPKATAKANPILIFRVRIIARGNMDNLLQSIVRLNIQSP
jgi:hypothetical protein